MERPQADQRRRDGGGEREERGSLEKPPFSYAPAEGKAGGGFLGKKEAKKSQEKERKKT